MMIRGMFCLIASVYLLQPLKAACTASVANPTVACIQSGIVNWTVTYSGCPSAYSATWVLDDFYNAGLVYEPTFSRTNFDMGTMLDRLGNGAC
jgi:hypothetical protein